MTRLPDPALAPPAWAARIPRWGWLALFVAGGQALRGAGYLMVDRPGGLAAVWPAPGLTVYALLVSRRRTWAAILALDFATGLVRSVGYGRPLRVALAYNVANTVQAVAVAWAIVAVGGRPTLRTLRGAMTVMLAPAAAVAAVSAVASAIVSASAAAVTQEQFWVFWAATSLGVLFLTSLLVEWTTPAVASLDGRRAGLAAAGIAAAFVAAMVLLRTRELVVDEVVLLPALLWAALRFGPRGATLALVIASGAVFATLSAGTGHIWAASQLGSSPSALTLQIFLALGGGSILAVAAVAEERRAAEERRVLLERAFDDSPDPAGVLDEEGRFVWANEAMARLLRVPRRALAERRAWELIPGGTPESWRERWDAMQAARTAIVEDLAPGPDGRLVPWEVAGSAVDVGGRSLLVCSLRDLSDRRRAEESSRLAALGTLAAGVAHEINNPISYVVANIAHVRDSAASLAASGPELRTEVLEPLAEAEEGARRVRDIVRQLHAFARPDDQLGAVLPARALAAALTIAQSELRHRARVITDIAETPPVFGNETRLTQAFVNLLVNAAQAIPAGDPARHEVRAVLRVEGDAVVAEISDTGSGMTPETRARVFEPFFTTKAPGTAPGAGVGLGLAITHSIVTGMGGRIDVDSEPGAGTRFRVVLPVARVMPAGQLHGDGPQSP